MKRKKKLSLICSYGFVFGILILLFSQVSCDRNRNNSIAILKQRIENANMKEYVDSIYGARLLYPYFFHVDTIGKYYVSYSYLDENVKTLSLEYDILPPRMFDNSKEAVRRLSDSLTTSSKVKKRSFILTQEYENYPQIRSVFKYYKTIHGWTCYTLTYEKQYEDAVEILIKMVKDWKIYNENYPKWFDDMCDFLDI